MTVMEHPEPSIQFASHSFSNTSPASLGVDEWVSDHDFVSQLSQSWLAQYTDYLGEYEAECLLERLLESGDIVVHNPKTTLIASIDGVKAGIASLRACRGFAMITMLEVLADYQRRGIGKQLIQALVATRIPLVAHVSIHRPAVNLWYRKLGFQSLQRIQVDHYGHLLWFDVVAYRAKP